MARRKKTDRAERRQVQTKPATTRERTAPARDPFKVNRALLDLRQAIPDVVYTPLREQDPPLQARRNSETTEVQNTPAASALGAKKIEATRPTSVQDQGLVPHTCRPKPQRNGSGRSRKFAGRWC